MGNEYKKIILLQGLEVINDYHFNIVKSLLADDLQLTKKTQEEYDRIKIADLMEEKFPNGACVKILIDLFKDIKDLKKDIIENLRKAMIKVAKKTKETKTPRQRSNQDRTNPASPTTTTKEGQKRKSTTKEKPVTKKKKVTEEQGQPSCSSAEGTSANNDQLQPPQVSSSTPSSTFFTENQEQQRQCEGATKRNTLQRSPLVVMVLKVTEPFKYKCPEKGESMMFHATVVTENKYFYVKVLNVNLKEKFTLRRIIVLTHYFEHRGVLEINELSSVSEAGPNQKIDPPIRIIKRANETPKIDTIQKQASGTFVYGLFALHKKKVNLKNTIYEIQDDTGKMDVVGSGKWHNINCKEGDKLRLYCFKLRTIEYKLKLACEVHSLIKKKDIADSRLEGKRRRKSVCSTEPRIQSQHSFTQTDSQKIKVPQVKDENEQNFGYSSTSGTESQTQTPVMAQVLSSFTFKEICNQFFIQVYWNCKDHEDTFFYYEIVKHSEKREKSNIIVKEEKEENVVCLTSSPQVQHAATQTSVSKWMKHPQEQYKHTHVLGSRNTYPTASQTEVHVMPPVSPSTSFTYEKQGSEINFKEASREEGIQKGPKIVMVLKATKPFEYEHRNETRMMFHATVATQSEFFHMKIFDINLKEKFTPKRVIAISDYVGRNGFLEVYNVSIVTDVNVEQKMEISSTLIKIANATPKIGQLLLQVPGTFVNGVFKVYKKMVRDKCIYYEIQDNTGKMEVLVYGRLTQINCQEGDKLQLICFELSPSMHLWQLRSVIHSFMKVIKAKKHINQSINPNSNMET
ncbi:PREDICTED: gamma-interferon-inducible protein 16 [Elephantulus edwardii]|uniref:gamma-interferon-inducible protein 16 n=1 Tax=Elephantulus edwardii TaxID=28737 RepID=UPI0003F062E1|nr:PREDICTED: gamma-interferon-inducible protein 16 [Elephantulus edwardii]